MRRAFLIAVAAALAWAALGPATPVAAQSPEDRVSLAILSLAQRLAVDTVTVLRLAELE